MQIHRTKSNLLVAILVVWFGLPCAVSVQAAALPINDGSVLLRMCKGADKVKALSVMCHSYLNGYIDAAHYFSKGKATFCLEKGEKERLPSAVVEWIGAHQDSLAQPAGAVLQKALSDRFPCRGGKQGG